MNSFESVTKVVTLYSSPDNEKTKLLFTGAASFILLNIRLREGSELKNWVKFGTYVKNQVCIISYSVKPLKKLISTGSISIEV